MSTAIAVVLFGSLIVYAIFAGADFGAGFWDLVAGGDRRGARPRAVIDHSIGPVWEANHVWLILTFVILWTGFPEAYAAIWSTLFIPLVLAALGIVLRGAGFAFRHAVADTASRRVFGAAFAVSSVIVPFCLGSVAGAVATGRVPADGSGDLWEAWLNPTSILGGVLAVAVVSYLAAVYLVWDAARLADEEMVEYFRRRALIAGVVAGVVAAVGIPILAADADFLYHRLLGRSWPIVALSAVCGVGALVQLHRDRHTGARLLAVGAVASVMAAWGMAQYDWLLPETLTIEQAAAPSGTLGALTVAVVLLVLFIVPAFALLFTLDQRGLLPEEGVARDDEVPEELEGVDGSAV